MRLRRGTSRSTSTDDGERLSRTNASRGDEPDVIDLRDSLTLRSRLDPDPVRAAEMAERFRARKAKLEAQQELHRLRERHWSGERVLEEGCRDIEWWTHPDADPYAVLGLLPGASLETAAAARRKVAQTCHPDRLSPDSNVQEAMLRMVAANAAYDRLRRALRPE